MNLIPWVIAGVVGLLLLWSEEAPEVSAPPKRSPGRPRKAPQTPQEPPEAPEDPSPDPKQELAAKRLEWLEKARQARKAKSKSKSAEAKAN